MNMDLSSRDRSRLLAVAILLAVFAAGAFGGAALTVAFRSPGRFVERHEERLVRRLWKEPFPGDHEGVVFMRGPGPLFERLDLTGEQSERVERLMQEQTRKAERLMADMEPLMKALMDSTNTAIEAVLTPEQRERFREMQEERRDMIRFRLLTPVPAQPREPAPPPE